MSFRRSSVLAVAGLALLLGACTKSLGNYFAPTAALVNGEKIAEADITRELRNAREQPQFAELFEGKDAAANRREAERQILTSLVQRTVLAQAAGKLGVTVSDSEIDDQVRRVAAQFESEKKFSEFLEEQHLTIDQARSLVRRQILIEGVQQKITTDSTVPDDQIRNYYDQNKATFDGQIHVAHIQVCANFDEQSELCSHVPEDQALASSIAGRARAGEDFAALARQFSKDSDSAQNGGDFGWVGPTPASPFDEAALKLAAPGEVSDPVQTPSGWNVIKLLGKGRPYEAAIDQIRELLLAPVRQEAFQKFLGEAISEAKIRVNPKYGRFDPRSQSVVAREVQNF